MLFLLFLQSKITEIEIEKKAAGPCPYRPLPLSPYLLAGPGFQVAISSLEEQDIYIG